MLSRERHVAAPSGSRLVAVAETLSRNAISLGVTQRRRIRPARAGGKRIRHNQSRSPYKGCCSCWVSERVEPVRGVDAAAAVGAASERYGYGHGVDAGVCMVGAGWPGVSAKVCVWNSWGSSERATVRTTVRKGNRQQCSERRGSRGTEAQRAVAALSGRVARSTERWGEVPLAISSGAGESYQPEVLFSTPRATASPYGRSELEPRAS
jgi:hypothetical protein